MGIGRCLIELGNIDSAITFLQDAQRAMPQEPLSYKLLAVCYEKNGDNKREAESLENYLQHCESMNPLDYSRLALLFNKEGTYLKAISFGRKAINLYELNSALTPNNKASEIVSLALNLADAYLQFEGSNSAIEFLDTSIAKLNSLSESAVEREEITLKIQFLENKKREIPPEAN